MVVVDAGVVVAALTIGRRMPEPLGRLASEVVHVPHLLDVEVWSALRGLQRGGKITADLAGRALADHRQLALVRHVHHPLADRVWQLRENVSSYDAVYLALSEVLEAPLITTDVALATVPGLRCPVEVVRTA